LIQTVLQLHWEMYQPALKGNLLVQTSLVRAFRKSQANLALFQQKLNSQLLSAYDLDSSPVYLAKKSNWVLKDFSEQVLKLKNSEQIDNESGWQAQIGTLRIAHSQLKSRHPGWEEYFPFFEYSAK
jgi:hypothetical protein